MAEAKLLETNNDSELAAAVKEAWQTDMDNLDRHIAKLNERLAEALAEKAVLEARIAL